MINRIGQALAKFVKPVSSGNESKKPDVGEFKPVVQPDKKKKKGNGDKEDSSEQKNPPRKGVDLHVIQGGLKKKDPRKKQDQKASQELHEDQSTFENDVENEIEKAIREAGLAAAGGANAEANLAAEARARAILEEQGYIDGNGEFTRNLDDGQLPKGFTRKKSDPEKEPGLSVAHSFLNIFTKIKEQTRGASRSRASSSYVRSMQIGKKSGKARKGTIMDEAA